MRKRILNPLLLSALVWVLGVPVWAGVTEAPAPQVQTAPPLAAIKVSIGTMRMERMAV